MLSLRVRGMQHSVRGPEHGTPPGIEFKIFFSLEDRREECSIYTLHGQLFYFGRYLSQTTPDFVEDHLGGGGQKDYSFFFPLTKDVLSGIESARKDDVQFSIRIAGLGEQYLDDGKSKRMTHIQANKEWSLSQKQWSEILKSLGYRDYWIVEIERPKIEGWEPAKDHLEEAATAIENHDYEKVLLKCRNAWESVEPAVKSKVELIKGQIDEGSAGDEKHETKSSRILSLQEAVKRLSHIGAHGESYQATSEDAILCFRTMVSLLSYLSKIMARMS